MPIAKNPNGARTRFFTFLFVVGTGIIFSACGSQYEDFTLVVLPDTQNYVDVKGSGRGTPEIFEAQTQWIVDNKDDSNIVYVAHLGDCVQNADIEEEWRSAEAAMSLLEASPEIPYGIAVGNHDQPSQLYNQYFGLHRFQEKPWYGGHHGTDNDNYYHLLSFGGLDFIVLYLEYATDALSWADGVLEAHKDRRAILVSHALLRRDDTFSEEGQRTFDMLKDNSNLFLMLCGHLDEARREDTFAGNVIHTLMADYQGRENGGNGWLRIMQFSPAKNKIFVTTYSPTLGKFETDANSQFTLTYEMSP
jgi:hypothetical protein